MPQYLFRNKITNEFKEVFFHMNDEKIFNGDFGNEKDQWERVFQPPNSSVDTKIDPNNSKDFVEKTRNKKGNIGNLIDQSKELSIARENSMGQDPVKKAYWDKWSKERGGRKPPVVPTQISA